MKIINKEIAVDKMCHVKHINYKFGFFTFWSRQIIDDGDSKTHYGMTFFTRRV